MAKDSSKAFPIIAPDSNGNYSIVQDGLSKREYFAAIALQGMLSNSFHPYNTVNSLEDKTKNAVLFADALIEKLKK